ncbi:MAG: RdgB/HAM1 family non-canonical purine NTP pyrophosphatase [Spirochaetaceae bacterium]|nr:MAG: RdgB/HAM1 family non-canonical purine NTP pyrophosphatase [Spirochaetaceae bacterium]
MNINEIVLATNNRHKQEEIAAALPGIKILLPEDAGLKFSFEETGSTFFENAYGKAEELFKKIRLPVMADDSGLCVPVLGGPPGIFSARFGADTPVPPGTDAERNSYLLSLLPEGGPHDAFFVCCMVLILGDYKFFAVQETVHGVLVKTPIGDNGFGYDPIFFLPELGKTVAELPVDEKNSLSHRGKAVKKMAGLLGLV